MAKIKELEKQISEAQESYYNGSSSYSDDEYDALIYELTCLDPKNKLLLKVGAEPVGEWKKEKHQFELGSLNKLNYDHELKKWISENLSNHEVLVCEKLDGLSIGCQYDDGNLTKAILRGNGYEGENILTNVLKMSGINKSLLNFNGVLRGEIVLTKTNHQKYFPTYSNPRNAASGLCRRLDGEGSEYLDVIFYQVLGSDFKTELDQIKFLEKNKFKVPGYKLCKTSDDVISIWNEYQKSTRDSLDYEIDGLVISCNDIEFQESLGITALRPKGKSAFKFANQFIKTTVKKISWDVGHTGRITPVCWFDQVLLLGSKIEKASVYNLTYIKELGLGIGAGVLICKANEIIPRVEKVLTKPSKIETAPKNCPECQSLTEFNGEYLICPNKLTCPAQKLGRFLIWVNELNILDWSEKTIQRLIDAKLVEDVADLYKLKPNQLENLERMGPKLAKKLIDILDTHRELPLEKIIGGLGISGIGSAMIKLCIENGYDTIDKLYAMSVNEIENIPGFANIKAKALFNGLIENKIRITNILNAGVIIKKKIIGNLTGKSFAFTGSLSIKRVEAERLVQNAGGIIKGNVCKGLSFLVISDLNSTSSKAEKARLFGTKCISEKEFLDLFKV